MHSSASHGGGGTGWVGRLDDGAGIEGRDLDPEDGLGLFVGVATGSPAPPPPEVLGQGGVASWLTSLRLPVGARRVRLGAALVGGVIVVALVAAVASGGGVGEPMDPELPLSGEVATDASAPSGAGGGGGGGAPGAHGSDGTGLSSAKASGTDTASAAGTAVIVHVTGAVATPGVHRLATGARVHDAVLAAGGPRTDADLERVNLAAPLGDGSQVHVPIVGLPTGPTGSGPAGSADGSGAVGGATAGGDGPVSLSVTDADGLQALPGVGPATAAAIIAHRDEHGPFSSVEELLDVRGIGPAKLDALRELVVP